MAKKTAKPVGDIGLIQELEDGRVVQIGLKHNQNKMLQMFLANLSKQSPLMKMPEAFDVVLRSDVKVMKRK